MQSIRIDKEKKKGTVILTYEKEGKKFKMGLAFDEEIHQITVIESETEVIKKKGVILSKEKAESGKITIHSNSVSVIQK